LIGKLQDSCILGYIPGLEGFGRRKKPPCPVADDVKALGIDGNVIVDTPVILVFRIKRLIE
jgi:hypothetical protein